MVDRAPGCDGSRVRRADSGQAIIETAIVMPLFVFLLLGILQLSLMNQARLMTKYAAFKAARAGSIGNVKMDRMEKAAAAVLLPFIAMGAGQNKMFALKAKSGTEFATSWLKFRATDNKQENGIPYVSVTVCGPTKDLLRSTTGQQNEYSFDDPSVSAAASSTDWKPFDRTRLSIQVSLNYRMIIPFANMVLWRIAFAEEDANTIMLTRTGNKKLTTLSKGAKKDKGDLSLVNLASQGVYVIPIRADWAMRMQSDLFPEADGYKLPESNECRVRFPKKEEGGASGSGGQVDPDDPGSNN